MMIMAEKKKGKKGRDLLKKLRRRAVFVGHRNVFRRPSTPVHISFNPNNPSFNFLSSSRKLAASLWEFYQYYDNYYQIPPVGNMFRAPYGFTGPNNRSLRNGHGKAAIIGNGRELTYHQPESAGSIRRQIGQMLMKHHHLTKSNNRALQPLSPTSYDSSIEEIDEASCSYPSRRRESPIRQWNTRTVTPDLGKPQTAKESSLKAKTESSKLRRRIFKGVNV